MIIYIDMDGVLSNFVGSLAPLLDMEETELEFKLFNHQTYNVASATGVSWADMNELINQQGINFWLDMEEYPWARKLLYDITDYYPKVYIASSPGTYRYAPSGKLMWLYNRTHDGFKNYVFTPYKHLLAGENILLLDDSPDNVSRFKRAGGQAVLFPQPWNCKTEEEYSKYNIVENIIDKIDNHVKSIKP